MPEDDITRRAARALALVQKGELSAGRQALEGADLAPGTMETLRELRDLVRRPARIRQPLPPQVTDHMPDRPFELEEYRFAQVLRSSRKGAAAGPSGMTADHLRPVLENPRDTHLLFTLGEKLARAEISDSILGAIRLGRLTALQKPSGGIVVGCDDWLLALSLNNWAPPSNVQLRRSSSVSPPSRDVSA